MVVTLFETLWDDRVRQDHDQAQWQLAVPAIGNNAGATGRRDGGSGLGGGQGQWRQMCA